MRHQNCTHPRGQVLVDEHVRVTRDQMMQMKDTLESQPDDATAIVLGPGLRYEVLECSWCRNPDAPVSVTLETRPDHVVSVSG